MHWFLWRLLIKIYLFSPPQQPRTEAPYFLKTIGSTEVYPGMQSKFTACIGGNPEPEFEWFRDGNRIHESPGSRIQLVRDGIGAGLIKLIVNDTNIGDLGEYKLRIFNDLGEASCAATLKFDCEFLFVFLLPW